MPPDLIPVDHDPFNELPMSLEPVEHDPFGTAPQGNVAGSLGSIVGGLGQRAADWYQRQPSWSDRMAAAQAGTDPTRLSGGVDPTAQLDALGGLVGSTTPKAGIRAYHGSPHDFEAFDLSKIGTGEGAQAYGHGLYFAEHEGTAKAYRDNLSDLKPRQVGDNPDLTLPSWVANKVASKNPMAINDVRTDFQGRLAEMKRQAADPNAQQPWVAEANIPGLQKILDALDHVEKGAEIKPAGRMYEVNINADPEHFLHWDKPLSEQPYVMQNAPQLLEAAKQEAYSRALAATSKPRADELWAMVKDPSRAPGEFALQAFEKNAARESYSIKDAQGNYQPSNAATKDDAIAQAGGDPSRVRLVRNPDRSVASTTLRDAGIPGIKYLDQGSRMTGGVSKLGDNYFFKGSSTPYKTQAEAEAASKAAGNATHNYVVFNDRLIDIARKYGLAGLIAGGVHHFSTTPVDHDPYAQ